jgi:hypothetical protein
MHLLAFFRVNIWWWLAVAAVVPTGGVAVVLVAC